MFFPPRFGKHAFALPYGPSNAELFAFDSFLSCTINPRTGFELIILADTNSFFFFASTYVHCNYYEKYECKHVYDGNI